MMPTVKPFLRLRLLQFVEYRLGHRRAEILRRQPVTAADDPGHCRALAARHGLRERFDDVEIERLARGAGLLGSVEDGDRAAGRRAGPRENARPKMGGTDAPAARRPSRPARRNAAAVSRAVSAPEPIRMTTRSASPGPS